MKNIDIYNYPRNFFLNITGKCNLKCIYCSSADFNSSYDMTKEQLQHIITELKSHGTLKVIITGGEPLLHSEFNWIIEKITQFTSINVNTNGIYLEEKMDFLKDFQFKKRLSFNVSLDSLYPEKNMLTRGYGNINKIINNIKKLYEMGYCVDLLITITNYFDEKDIEMFKIFFEENPGIGFSLNDLKITGRASKLKNNLLPSLDIIKLINDKFSNFQNFEFHLEDEKKEMANLIQCGAGKECLSIAQSGDIYPCTAMYIKIGNIFENTIREICDNSNIIKQLNEMRNKKIDSILECKECVYNHSCNGGCRANAFIATGNLYGVDPYCWYKGDYYKNMEVSCE